jgi:hypothetical protein
VHDGSAGYSVGLAQGSIWALDFALQGVDRNGNDLDCIMLHMDKLLTLQVDAYASTCSNFLTAEF